MLQTSKKTKHSLLMSRNATKEDYKYNGGPISRQRGYLKVRGKNDRVNYPLQDWRVCIITHQAADQSVPFQGVQKNWKLQVV